MDKSSRTYIWEMSGMLSYWRINEVNKGNCLKLILLNMQQCSLESCIKNDYAGYNHLAECLQVQGYTRTFRRNDVQE